MGAGELLRSTEAGLLTCCRGVEELRLTFDVLVGVELLFIVDDWRSRVAGRCVFAGASLWLRLKSDVLRCAGLGVVVSVRRCGACCRVSAFAGVLVFLGS